MVKHNHVAVVIFWLVLPCLGRGQQVIHKTTAQFPGSVLKWIHIAEVEFTKQHLDESRYDVLVWEEQNSVSVILENPGHEKDFETRGNPGPLPEYEVEIDRRTGHVIRANYVR
jgi:hypothetical protein